MFGWKSLAFSVALVCVCFYAGEASRLAAVTWTSNAVQNALPLHIRSRLSGHQSQINRLKRDVMAKSMDDPKSCVYQCDRDETDGIINITIKHTIKLIGVAMQSVDFDSFDDPAKEEEQKKKIETETINNMGPMFDDFCENSQKTTQCLKKCPDSQLKQVATALNINEPVFCESTKNWPDFRSYYNAIDCLNKTTIDEKPCEKKCGGEERNITSETHMELKLDENNSKFTSETDAKKNTDTANSVCKQMGCYEDCNKPILVQKCGQKTADLYVRMEKLEPSSALKALKVVRAINDASDCKRFQ